MQDISKKYTIKKIEGTFAVDNIVSRRVMEKLGMTFDRDTEYSNLIIQQLSKQRFFQKSFSEILQLYLLFHSTVF